jgi:hypothetical protein
MRVLMRNIFTVMIVIIFCSIIVDLKGTDVAFKNNTHIIDFVKMSNSIYGRWKIVKFIEGDLDPGSSRKGRKFLNKSVFLEANLAVVFQDSCKYPQYEIKRYNTEDYLWNNYRQHLPLGGIPKDSVTVVELTCSGNPIYASKDSPIFDNEFMLIGHDTLVLGGGGEGLFFFLKRMEEDSGIIRIPQNGDTVRCIYGKKCGYTGYVIQGTRAKGHAIHGNPVNKNVPMEQVDKKDLKKEDEDK